MQVKLFLECSQSPNILRRKLRPTITSSNDRSEKSKKSECVKCGSVYTVQYLGRKKEKQQKLEEKCPSAKSLYLLQMEVIEMSTVGGPVQNMGTCRNPLHSYWIVAESHRRRSCYCFGGDKRVAHASRLEAVVDLLRLAVSQIPSFSAVCTL